MRILETVQPHMLTHLLRLCKQELDIEDLPPINFVEDSTVGGGTSFGEFTDNGIDVVTVGRHQMDICRTLAHELVHWKQRISGQELDGSDGSETENEANAVAGVILRKFGHMYPQYFVDILP
jgi:hypothetical protein